MYIDILRIYLSASFAAKAHAAITNKMLKTAEPTIVPIPTSLWAINTPIMLVKSSGAEPPAAINVAPATSGLIPSYNLKKMIHLLLHVKNIVY